MIFGTNLSTLNIGLMICGRARWQEAEATRKGFNAVLTRQDKKFFTFGALQGHSGRNSIDPSLQDIILIPNNFFEYVYLIGCAVNLHSITNSGLIAGGQNSSRDRQTVFFTAVNPMHKNHQILQAKVESAPRYGVLGRYLQLAQKKGFKFCQTRSNAVILYDTLPAYCISKAVVVKSEEIKYQKVYVSPRPPPTISYKDHWMNELDSEIAGSSKDTQRIQPEPQTKLSRTVRLVTRWREETLGRTKFDRDTLNHEKHDEVTDPTSTGETRIWTRIHKTLRFDTQTC